MLSSHFFSNKTEKNLILSIHFCFSKIQIAIFADHTKKEDRGTTLKRPYLN
jgi:hypothetical protein